MTSELDELKRREAAAETILRDARTAREAVERKQEESRREPLKELAILAHSTLCAWNHTDGCGWEYEVAHEKGVTTHNWNAWAHDRWLKHIDKLLNSKEAESYGRRVVVPDATPELLREILETVRTLRAKHPSALWLIQHGLNP